MIYDFLSDSELCALFTGELAYRLYRDSTYSHAHGPGLYALILQIAPNMREAYLTPEENTLASVIAGLDLCRERHPEDYARLIRTFLGATSS